MRGSGAVVLVVGVLIRYLIVGDHLGEIGEVFVVVVVVWGEAVPWWS